MEHPVNVQSKYVLFIHAKWVEISYIDMLMQKSEKHFLGPFEWAEVSPMEGVDPNISLPPQMKWSKEFIESTESVLIT